ncbi:MAG: AtpZ/AtpI family protein [Dehalococcoidia bacterium]|jgi:F0F1-type ATP synthase assembly protein I|nr:AtpZ/AtpI family protein [Dehalococcoidia bacterium]
MNRSPGFERYAVAARLLGMGWYVVASILGGVLGGLWLDERTGLDPLFTLLGLTLGLAAAFYGVYKMAAPLLAGSDQNRRGRG